MAGKTPYQRRVRQNQKEPCPDLSARTAVRSRPICIFIADGYEVVRAGLCALLKGERDLEVVGQADHAKDLLIESQRTKPDVLLLAYGLPGSTEREMCQRLSQALPAVQIIALIEDNDTIGFRRAIEVGVQGFLLGTLGRDELIKVVRALGKRDSYLDPEAFGETFRLLKVQTEAASPSELRILSPQEHRIISCIAEGYTNKKIAAKMVLSDKTVKNYIANMFVKLEINHRTQAVALYLKAQSLRLESQSGSRSRCINPLAETAFSVSRG
ncbi:MAG TPA: response regulator transcription factor [Nitrospira sp.]|nr:response regulator transcription factor [Nitrospira sp.]